MSINEGMPSPAAQSSSGASTPFASSPIGARTSEEGADCMTGLRPAKQSDVRRILSRCSQDSRGFAFGTSNGRESSSTDTAEPPMAIPNNVLQVILSGMPQWRADGTASLVATSTTAATTSEDSEDSDASISSRILHGGAYGREGAGDLTDGGYYTTPSHSAVEASLCVTNLGTGKRAVGFPRLGAGGGGSTGSDAGTTSAAFPSASGTTPPAAERPPPRRARRGSASVTICTPGTSSSPTTNTAKAVVTSPLNASTSGTHATSGVTTDQSTSSAETMALTPAQGAPARTLLQRRRSHESTSTAAAATKSRSESAARSPLATHSVPASAFQALSTLNALRSAHRPATHTSTTATVAALAAASSTAPLALCMQRNITRPTTPPKCSTGTAPRHSLGSAVSSLSSAAPSTVRSAKSSVAGTDDEDEAEDDQEANPVSGPTAQFYSRAQLAQNHDGAKYLNDYMVFHDVGRGASGKVVMGYSVVTSKTVAIKIIAKPKRKKYALLRAPSVLDADLDASAREDRAVAARNSAASAQGLDLQLLREIDVMKNLNHKNIVRLHEVINDPTSNKIYLIMQYIDKGAVAEIDPEGHLDHPFSSLETARIAVQAAAGLAYLHKKGVVHRDIKPENMLMNSEGTVFLADFGVAEMFPDEDAVATVDKLGFQGTPLFMAPEVYVRPDDLPVLAARFGANQGSAANLLSDKTTPGLLKIDLFALDIWALGVTLTTLLTGEVPLKQVPEIRQLLLDGEDALPLPTTVPMEWRALLHDMVQTNQKLRPSAREVRTRTQALLEQLEASRMEASAAKAGAASRDTEGARTTLDDEDEVLVVSDNENDEGPACFVPLRSHQFSPSLDGRSKVSGGATAEESASISHPALVHRRTITTEGVTESKNGAASTLPDSTSRSGHSPIRVEPLRPSIVNDQTLIASPVFSPLTGTHCNQLVAHRRSLPSGLMPGVPRAAGADATKLSLKASLYKVAMQEKMT